MKIIVTIILTNVVTDSLLSHFCSFVEIKNKNSNFWKVDDVVARSISVFYLERDALFFKGMPNSIDFYKRNFLLVIPARITVPGFIIQFQRNAVF